MLANPHRATPSASLTHRNAFSISPSRSSRWACGFVDEDFVGEVGEVWVEAEFVAEGDEDFGDGDLLVGVVGEFLADAVVDGAAELGGVGVLAGFFLQDAAQGGVPGVVVDACEAEWGGGTVAGGAGRVGVEVALEGDDDADGAGVAGEVQVVVGLGVGVAGRGFGVVGGSFGERHGAFGDASQHGELAGFALGGRFGGWVGRGHGVIRNIFLFG